MRAKKLAIRPNPSIAFVQIALINRRNLFCSFREKMRLASSEPTVRVVKPNLRLERPLTKWKTFRDFVSGKEIDLI